MPQPSQSLISDMFKTMSRLKETSTSTHDTPQQTNSISAKPTPTPFQNNTNPTSISNTTTKITATSTTQHNIHDITSKKKYRQTTILPSTSHTIPSIIPPTTTKDQSRFKPITKATTFKNPRNPYKKKNKPVKGIQSTINIEQKNDFKWIGTKICRRPTGYIRFWSQNRNGISRWNNFKNFAEELQALQHLEVQYLSYTETNINAHNTYIRDQMQSVLDEIAPASHLQLSSTNVSHASESLQYGGTLSIAQGPLASRFNSKGHDKFGRYSWMLFNGRKTQLRIYTVYRPVRHTDNSAGDGTVWAQHREILQKNGIHTDPRSHII